jgi:steroid delta-isomerase-like uncharacterized protein
MTTTRGLQPHSSTRDEPALHFLGLPTLLRATGPSTDGAFGLIEHLMIPPGFASPYHVHRLEDEAFYVLAGEMAFVCGGHWLTAGPGTYVFGPRTVPHGFKVLGDSPARLLLLCAPAGFEQSVLDLSEPEPSPGVPPSPPDMARLAAAAATYGVDLLGPLPEEPHGWAAQARPAGDLRSLNHRWIQAFNERDWVTERAIRSPEYRAYLSGAPEALDAEAWSGFMLAFTTAFPDARISIEACIAEGDTVATRWRLTGTHLGEFQGIPPTGRPVTFSGLEFNRVADGRFVEHWSMFDNVALLRQIGTVPA